MRKTTIAFDGAEYSEGAMSFARQMNYAERISLTGLFLPQAILSNLWSYADSSTGTAFIPLVEAGESHQINQNIAHFQEQCRKYNIKSSVQKDFFDFALPELRSQTRFSDLVIIGSESFYKQFGSDSIAYLKDALHSSECPVIVVPEKYEYPKSNIIAYDGTESSVFAIKQFIYLFPEFSEFPTLLVTVCRPGVEHEKNVKNIKDLVADHFSSLSYLSLDLDDDDNFSTWVSEKNGSILVCGAFSGSFLSQLFHHSFVEDVIRDRKIPLFISHR